MDDFPRFDNETEAVLKYADWLERLGIALRREAKRQLSGVLHDIFNPHPPVPSEHEHLLALPIAGSLKGGC